jgi:hypothetical protein
MTLFFKYSAAEIPQHRDGPAPIASTEEVVQPADEGIDGETVQN